MRPQTVLATFPTCPSTNTTHPQLPQQLARIGTLPGKGEGQCGCLPDRRGVFDQDGESLQKRKHRNQSLKGGRKKEGPPELGKQPFISNRICVECSSGTLGLGER